MASRPRCPRGLGTTWTEPPAGRAILPQSRRPALLLTHLGLRNQGSCRQRRGRTCRGSWEGPSSQPPSWESPPERPCVCVCVCVCVGGLTGAGVVHVPVVHQHFVKEDDARIAGERLPGEPRGEGHQRRRRDPWAERGCACSQAPPEPRPARRPEGQPGPCISPQILTSWARQCPC